MSTNTETIVKPVTAVSSMNTTATCSSSTKSDQQPTCNVISDPFLMSHESDDELVTMVLQEEQPPTKPEKVTLKQRKKITIESSDSEPEVKLFRTTKDGNSTDAGDNKKPNKMPKKAQGFRKRKKIL